MRALAVLAAAAALAASGSAHAMTVKHYEELYALGDQGEDVGNVYLDGMNSGFLWANAVLQVQKRQPLFCQPPKLILDTSQVKFMVDRAIAERRVAGQYKEDDHIEMLLLAHLREVFPCT